MPNFISQQVPISHKAFNGGLNSTAGPLSLQDNESSDLQNVDFDQFGSLKKRSGYTVLSTAAVSANSCDGLYWAEFTTAGAVTRAAVSMFGTKFYKMDDLDGVWDDVTGGITITSANHFDFEMYNTTLFFTNGVNPPAKWVTGDTASAAGIPTGLTKTKYVAQFNNYLFYANVTVSNVNYPTRIYWSALRDPSTWDSADWIEVSKDDGQEITGVKVLSDRLVVFKEKSIYNVFYTGDADIPFILPGGGKSNSSVGCIAPFSIQEVQNGLVFLAPDGIYYYDGMNSYRISDKIMTTLVGYSSSQFVNARSLVYKKKSQYILSFAPSGQTQHTRLVVWDFTNNAFIIYVGFTVSALGTFYVSGVDERPYFGNYTGWVYRMDTGADDYPLNTQTAINSYFYTNWKSYDDLCDQKGVPHLYIYYQSNTTTMNFAYSYDFEETDQYTDNFSLSQTGSDVFGTGVYGVARYSGSGGGIKRKDLIGRGRVVRFKFANSTLGETFRIDGFGAEVQAETNV